MNLEDIILSEINQSQKDECCMTPLMMYFRVVKSVRDSKQNGGFQGAGERAMGSIILWVQASILPYERSPAMEW